MIVHEPDICRQKKHEWKYWFRNVLDSQSRFNLINGGDTVGAVSIGDGGVLLTGVVAEQQHLLAVERVFRPGDV